jgi:outer membrane protein OmpA-like peptidoglycan-associated protein
VYQRGKMAAPKTAVATAAVAPAPAAMPAADAAQNAADAASVKVENGVVKFYFASGKAELAAGANEALADVIKGAQAGKKLVISGYHDATGSAAQNAEVAKQRAFAVRDALKAAGVPEEKIELKKPEEVKVSGSNAEARRVEVTLQ